MAVLSVQPVSLSGLEANYANAAGGGDQFVNDGNTFFHVKNGDASDKTVTFNAQPTSVQTQQYGDLPVSDRAVTVTAGEERFVGPFPAALFNNASGRVEVSYSGVTDVTVAAIKLPRLPA